MNWKLYVPPHEICALVDPYPGPIDSLLTFCSHRDDVVFVESPEAADLIVIFEDWSTKFYGYCARLKEEFLFYTYPNKVVVVNYDDLGRGFLPGCYTSLNRSNYRAGFHAAIPYFRQYNTLIDKYALLRDGSPRYLFSFRGTDASAPVRKNIFRSFSNLEDSKIVKIDVPFHNHSDEEKKCYIRDILESHFVLCPRGWSPSSYRLYEVMQLSRCPVIISDDWIPISGINWDECAILCKEEEILTIPDLLCDRKSEALARGRVARSEWERCFAPRRNFQRLLDFIIEVGANVLKYPTDYEAYWRSWSFRRSNGWTLPQRASRLLGRISQAFV